MNQDTLGRFGSKLVFMHVSLINAWLRNPGLGWWLSDGSVGKHKGFGDSGFINS